MTVLVNGKFNTQTSAADRGLLYGQSVFETLAVVNGKPSLLNEHLSRLSIGCNLLGIPIIIKDLLDDIDAILQKCVTLQNHVLRITVTMGDGGRGYANPMSPHPVRILSLHDYPNHSDEDLRQGITLGVSAVRLSHQPLLAGIKHGNRLEQVLARSQWQGNWHEAVLCDHHGNVIEGTQSNVILTRGKQAFTPLLDQCGVDGLMKNWTLAQLKDAGFSCHAMRLSLQDIKEADEVMMTNSIIGVWPVKHFQCLSVLTDRNDSQSREDTQNYSDFSTAHRLIEQLQKNEIIPSH